MHTLRLFAISIDAVRDIFGADAQLAERLRSAAATRFGPPPAPAPPKGFLARLGLARREPALEVDPRQPLAGDVEAVLAGGYVPPERMSQAWQLLEVFLEELSDAHGTQPVTDVDELEFDLARAGLASDYSLRQLAGRPLGTPLRPDPEHLTGYAKHVHAVETAQALTVVADNAGNEFRAVLDSIQPTRRVLAAVAANPTLDLVVVELRRE